MAIGNVLKNAIKATTRAGGKTGKLFKEAVENTPFNKPVKTVTDKVDTISEVSKIEKQETFLKPKSDITENPQPLVGEPLAKAKDVNIDELRSKHPEVAKSVKSKKTKEVEVEDSPALSRLKKVRDNIFEDEELALKYGEERIAKLKEAKGINEVKKQIYDGYSSIKTNNYKNIIDNSDSFSGALKDRKKLETASKGIFYHKTLSMSLAVEEKHRYFSSVFSNAVAKRGGEKAFNILQDFHTDPKRALSKYGLEERDLFKALRDPTSIEDENLRAIGESFREMDSEYVKYVEGLSHIGEVEKYILPLVPSDTALRALGVDGYAALLMKHLTHVDEDIALAVAEKTLNANKSKDLYNIKITPSKSRDFFDGLLGDGNDGKKVGFRSLDDEYDFIKAIMGGEDSESSVLSKALQHKELQLTKAFVFTEFGADPRKTIRKTFDHVINKYEGSDKVDLVKTLASHEEYVVKTIELAMGKGYQETSTFRLYMEALSKYVSGVFGAPASFVRQIFTDTTGQSLTVSKALLDDSTLPGHIHSKMFKPLQTLFTVAATGGKDSPLRKELTNLLQIFGFSTTQNSLFKGMGVKMESFFGSVALQGSGSKLDDFGVTLNNLAGRLNGKINDLSGNSLHFDTLTMVNTWNAANAFSRLVFNKSWDEWSKTLGKRANYLEDMFDIGENEFRALKEVPKTSVDIPNLEKHLGLKQGDGIILPSEIRNMPEEVANKYKRPTETTDRFKTRLEKSYFSLLLDERQTQQVTVTRANRFVSRGLTKGTAIDLLLRPFTQFADISNEQYQAIKRGLSVSLYGNPWELGYAPKNRKEFLEGWGRAYAFYTGFGLSVLWAKDLLAGRQPGKISKQKIYQASTGSGVMGIPGMVLGSLSFGKKGFFGNTPTGGLIDTIAKARKGPYNAFKAVQRGSGVGKLWWASGVTDFVGKRAFLSEQSRKNMDRWYQKHTGSRSIGGK